MKTKEEIYREACAARDEKNKESVEKARKQEEIKKKMVLQKFPDVVFENNYAILVGMKFSYDLYKGNISLYFNDEYFNFWKIRDMAELADFLEKVEKAEKREKARKEEWESILFKIYQAFNKFFKKS